MTSTHYVNSWDKTNGHRGMAYLHRRDRDQIADGDPDPSGVHHLGLLWRDKTGHVVAREGGQLIAHAGWVEVDLHAGGQVVPALGLGAVLVHPRARKQGVGKAIVSAAMTSMRRIGRPSGCCSASMPSSRSTRRLAGSRSPTLFKSINRAGRWCPCQCGAVGFRSATMQLCRPDGCP